MQTPLEPHWRDDATRLKHDDSDERKREVAKLYLRRCHEVGLEVIGITDHNFAPKASQSFIHWLRRENSNIAQELGRLPIFIFPGFEVEAKVGTGCHILCLFPPNTSLDVVDSRVTALYLSPDNRFTGKDAVPSQAMLPEILKLIQKDKNHKGIVIAAHALAEKGIFDNDRISEWWQQDEFTNLDLLCVEVSKLPNKMSLGWQRLFKGDDKCLDGYRRQRPIAYIMSSDCYHLTPINDDRANYIGYRHTWIKMSNPSIEALRQAFLDPSSRIRFSDKSPDAAFVYPTIKRLSIEGGTFVRSVDDIHWSPNLNCVIGSRGTGKSTVIDYLRIALDQLHKGDIPETLENEVLGRVQNTLLPGSRVEVEIETVGGAYTVIYSPGSNPERQIVPAGDTEADPNLNIRELFPCRFLSQREIDHSVGRRDRDSLRKFLDDFIRPLLEDSERAAQKIKLEISQIEMNLAAKREIIQKKSVLQTRKRDLEALYEKQKNVAAVLSSWREVETELNFFKKLSLDTGNIVQSVRSSIINQSQSHLDLQNQLQTSQNSALVSETGQLFQEALADLNKGVEAEAAIFEAKVKDASNPLQVAYRKWRLIYDKVKQEVEGTKKELADAGTAIEGLEHIPQTLLGIESELVSIDKQTQEIEQLEDKRKEAVEKLRQVWQTETDMRVKKAKSLMLAMQPDPNKKPAVGIVVTHQSDEEALIQAISLYITHKGKLNEDDIRGIIDCCRQVDKTTSASLLEKFIAETRKRENSDCLDNLSTTRKSNFLEMFDENTLRQLEVTRVKDQVSYYAYRPDGTFAGEVDKVSAGQQGTAILNLMLSDGTDPLIVDTPEEGLDNEGVYTELVPLFRRAKETRQIVIVTHYANLPVNGDAEHIVALEASSYMDQEHFDSAFLKETDDLTTLQRATINEILSMPDWSSKLRLYLTHNMNLSEADADTTIVRVLERLKTQSRIKKIVDTENGSYSEAVGGLDMPAVMLAVQNIMEGSEAAFRKRSEKYGF